MLLPPHRPIKNDERYTLYGGRLLQLFRVGIDHHIFSLCWWDCSPDGRAGRARPLLLLHQWGGQPVHLQRGPVPPHPALKQSNQRKHFPLGDPVSGLHDKVGGSLPRLCHLHPFSLLQWVNGKRRRFANKCFQSGRFHGKQKCLQWGYGDICLGHHGHLSTPNYGIIQYLHFVRFLCHHLIHGFGPKCYGYFSRFRDGGCGNFCSNFQHARTGILGIFQSHGQLLGIGDICHGPYRLAHPFQRWNKSGPNHHIPWSGVQLCHPTNREGYQCCVDGGHPSHHGFLYNRHQRKLPLYGPILSGHQHQGQRGFTGRLRRDFSGGRLLVNGNNYKLHFHKPGDIHFGWYGQGDPSCGSRKYLGARFPIQSARTFSLRPVLLFQ